MKIQSLYLKNYAGFILSGITEFYIDVRSSLSIILGTNGSGKSSLLRELTPLPGANSDYAPGGMKKIVIEHRGITYTISSEFGKRSAHHSFLKGDEELNPGGTAAVQKEMAEQELGFTHALHDILTGRVTFTSMSTAKRREWITALSSTDLTYINNLHQTFKTSARDVSGALKHGKNRLAKESSRLVDLDKAEYLDAKVKELNTDLQLLIEHKSMVAKGSIDIRLELSNVNERIKTNSSVLRDWCKQGKFVHGESFESLEDQIQDRERARVEAGAHVESATSELANLKNMLETMTPEAGVSVESLEGKITTLNEQLGNLPRVKEEFEIGGDLRILAQDVELARSSVNAFVETLPFNLTPRKTKEECTEINEEIKRRTDRLFQAKEKLNALQRRQSHIEESKENTCPKCNYIWKPGISEGELSDVLERIKLLVVQIDQDEAWIETHQVFLEEFREYIRHLKSFRNIVESFPRLRPVWERAITEKLMETAPRAISDLLTAFGFAVERAIHKERIELEIEDTLRSLDHLRNIDTSQGTKLQERVSLIEYSIDAKIKLLESIDNELRELRQCLKNMRGYVDLLESIAADAELIEKLRDDYIAALRSEFIDEHMYSTSSKLATLQAKLNESDTLTGIVNDIKNSVAELELDYEAWKLLVDATSPQTGLIAKQMTGFINALTGQLNSVVRNVWEYELNVIPCGLDDGGLNYKFPLKLHKDGTTNTVKDIDMGSTAQKEIVDFAFMMVVMFYRDLQDYPLFLDEVGASFDPTHRERLIQYIKRILEDAQCSQIYLISHYASFSGGLSNADICVLDKSNIAVPDEYNKHVTIN